MPEIAKFILESQTPEQRELHDAGGDEDISSVFHYVPRKMMWSTHLPAKVPSSQEGTGGSVTYTFDNTAHFLMYTVMHTSFPAIRVKREYEKTVQICWPHN